jgi:hypothetical protein
VEGISNMAERKVINGFIVERQPNGAIVTIGPAPTAQNGPAVTRVPLPPATAARNQADLSNTSSQIGSRAVSDVNTNANTGKTVLETNLKGLEYDDALKNRARGVIVEDAATQEVRNQLLAVRNARQYNNEYSTGTIGGLLGRPDRPGAEGSGIAGFPVIGGALYAGTDRAGLEAALGTIRSGAKFNMIQTLKERGAAQGAQGTGLGSTAIPEFEALGRVNFNVEPDALDTNPQFVSGELDKAEETLLRRYAAVTLPSDVLVGATREQRKALLDASYEQAKREYLGGFAPGGTDQGGGGQGGGGGGGLPSLTPENMSRGPQTIGKTEFKLLPDPAKKGLNTTVQGMIRNGSSASEIISLLETRGVPMSDVLVSTVQRNVEAYRPYAGKPLPKDLPDPRVSVEVQMEERPFLERVAGDLADTSYGAGAVGIANGVLLGGLDELASGGDPERMAQIDAYKRYTSENSPIASTLGNIAGGIASFLPVGRGINAGAKAAQLSPTVARLVQGGANVAMGATAGALENNQDRKTGALIGGGAALGGDLAGNYIGGKLAGRLAEAPSGAESLIADNVVNPDLARRTLDQADSLALPTTLADADPGARALTYNALTNSAEAGQQGRQTLLGRDRASGSRAVLAVDSNLAAETNVVKLGKDITGKAVLDAAPIKQAAFSKMSPVADTKLNELLQRPSAKAGLANAQKIAKEEGRDWKALGVDLDGEGNIVLKEGASWESLDYMRRGIDSYIDTFRNDAGKLVYDRGGNLRAVLKTRGDMVDRMRGLNDDYGGYLDTLSPAMSQAEQLTLGGKAIMSPKTNAKEIAEHIKDLSPEDLDSYRIGVANKIIDQMKRKGRNQDPWEMLRGDDMQERLKVVFPEADVSNINTRADFEDLMRETKRNLIDGSQTDPRRLVSDSFAAQAGQPGILARVAEGGAAIATSGVSLLPSLVRQGSLSFKNAGKLEAVRNQEALAKELQPILLETDPKKAKAALDKILAKVDTFDKVKKTSKEVGRSVGAGAMTGILAQ